jgi:hypothetical protein
MMSMTMLHLAATVGLFVTACIAITAVLAVLLSALAALEPATLRITHPPTRRSPRRE